MAKAEHWILVVEPFQMPCATEVAHSPFCVVVLYSCELHLPHPGHNCQQYQNYSQNQREVGCVWIDSVDSFVSNRPATFNTNSRDLYDTNHAEILRFVPQEFSIFFLVADLAWKASATWIRDGPPSQPWALESCLCMPVSRRIRFYRTSYRSLRLSGDGG
jgi:hypothetical protein